MRQQLHLMISGEVVGVFFRTSAQKQAQELGLTGWAHNVNSDVEILAQGEEEKLKEFLQWCKNGPEWVKVANVEVDWQEPQGKLTKFEIK